MSFLGERAYEELYNKPSPYTISVRYSKAFKGYNGNVRFDGKEIAFRISHPWKTVSDDMVVGLLQTLLNKLFKTKIRTMEIDMYSIFMKKLHLTIPVTVEDPILKEAYNRVNDKYFAGMVSQPNLQFSQGNMRKLGSYDYSTDTITISSILLKDENLLDYVMYHELLHKKLKFHEKNGRSYHHTREFRQKEKEYEDPHAEEKLRSFLRGQRARKVLLGW